MTLRSRSKINERERKENLEVVAIPRSGSQCLVGGKMRGKLQKINKKKKKGERDRGTRHLEGWKMRGKHKN